MGSETNIDNRLVMATPDLVVVKVPCVLLKTDACRDIPRCAVYEAPGVRNGHLFDFCLAIISYELKDVRTQLQFQKNPLVPDM